MSVLDVDQDPISSNDPKVEFELNRSTLQLKIKLGQHVLISQHRIVTLLTWHLTLTLKVPLGVTNWCSGCLTPWHHGNHGQHTMSHSQLTWLYILYWIWGCMIIGNKDIYVHVTPVKRQTDNKHGNALTKTHNCTRDKNSMISGVCDINDMCRLEVK